MNTSVITTPMAGTTTNTTARKMNAHFLDRLARALYALEIRMGILRSGYQMRLSQQLKMMCAMATVTAAMVGFARAAIRPVTVVPMFAPSMKGNARFSFTAPAPAMGTMRLVVTELDCTEMVEKIGRGLHPYTQDGK